MQNLSSAMDVALAQSVTYLCRIWKLKLPTSEEFFFTDLTGNITVGGQLYKFDPGIKVSAVVKTAGGQPDNAQVEITTSANFMQLNRIRQGALKDASFDMWIVDWRDPDHYGLISLFSGGIGELKFQNKGKIDLGLNSSIGGGKALIGEQYSRQCRARLGDSRCKFDLEGAKLAVEITAITNNGYTFASTSLVGLPDDNFKFGKVVWDSGLNNGLTDEIKASNGTTGTATFVLYPRNPLVIGDTGFIYPGCDFQVSTCGQRFNNLNNFRGEPYVPPANTYVFQGKLASAADRVAYYADAGLGFNNIIRY